MKKKQFLSMVLVVLMIFGMMPYNLLINTVKAESTFDPNNINWTIPIKSKDNMISFNALKTPLKSKKEIRNLKPTIASSLSSKIGSSNVLTIKVEIFNEQAGDRILYIPVYNKTSYEGMYLPNLDYNTELYYGDKFKISSYTITPGVISTSSDYGYRNGDTIDTETRHYSFGRYDRNGNFRYGDGRSVTFHLNVVSSQNYTFKFYQKNNTPIKPIQIAGGDLSVSGSYSASRGSYTTSVVDSPYYPDQEVSGETFSPSSISSTMSGGTSYDSSGPSTSIYVKNINAKTITVEGYNKNNQKIFTNRISPKQNLNISTETTKIVIDGKKDGFTGNIKEATPYFPEEAFEKAKQKAKDEINALENLTKAEKDIFINQVDKTTKIEEIKPIVDNAKAKDLENAKTKAKDIIKALPNLSETEINDFNDKIDKATTKDEVNKIVEEAKAKDKENALNEIKQKAKDEIDNLPNLAPDEKDNFKKDVDDAIDEPAINEIVEDAKIKSLERQVKDLTDKLNTKTQEINNLNEKIKTLENQIAEQKIKSEADAKEIERLTKELENLKKQLNDKDTEIDKLNKEIASLKETIKTLEKEKTELINNVARLEAEIKDLKEKLETANNRIIELEKENEALKEENTLIKDTNQKLETKVEKLEKDIKDKDTEIKDLTNRISELEKQLLTCQNECKTNEEKCKLEKENLQSEIDKLKKDLEQCAADESDKVKELTEEIAQKEKLVIEINNNIETKDKLIQELKEKLNTETKETKKLNEKIKELEKIRDKEYIYERDYYNRYYNRYNEKDYSCKDCSKLEKDNKDLKEENQELKDKIKALKKQAKDAKKGYSYKESYVTLFSLDSFLYRTFLGTELIVQTEMTDFKGYIKPFISNNRTMLPMRYTALSLGLDVHWNNETRTATFVNSGANNKLKLGFVTINADTLEMKDQYGQVINVDSKPVLKDGRFYVSISNIIRAFGGTQGYIDDGVKNTIEWNPVTQNVLVYKYIN